MPSLSFPAASLRQALPAAEGRSRGQMLVVFVLSIFVLIGVVATVVDISWYWSSSLRAQRAADAAALAGVVYLPGNVAQAVTTAKAAAAANGFTDGLNGVVVTPYQDNSDDRRMDVDVQAPVSTFFARLFGITTFQTAKSAKAEFILAVPMGSPQNYYGVDQLRRAVGATTAVPDATGVGTLTSQGAWGAVITKGGNHQNGDAYSPTWDDARASANADYDPDGYPYEVVIPAGDSNGTIWIFDPSFCGVGPNPTGGYYGTGDHWIAGTIGAPVSTYFTLYNENATPYDWTDDTLVTSSGSLFENQAQTDQGKSGGSYIFGTPQSTTVPDCSADTYHNRWWRMTTGLLPGTYRLQISTTNQGNSAINAGTNAENLWSLEATASGAVTPQVHGAGRMAVYNNLVSGLQTFYMAQIDSVHAGKTLEIDLFDPGDVSGDAFIRIKNPDGNAYNYATFSYTTDNQCASNCSGNNVTQIQTHYANGTSPFNNTWLTILIPLPSTYGLTGLTPAGETQAGWWKIEYNVNGGNDTTTWRVLIRGNPVHLIVP
jgi:Flp pilus assembly protein TadG